MYNKAKPSRKVGDKSMESKLKMVAELMRFSGDDYFPDVTASDELSLEELEMVSAAAARPEVPDFNEFLKKVKNK